MCVRVCECVEGFASATTNQIAFLVSDRGPHTLLWENVRSVGWPLWFGQIASLLSRLPRRLLTDSAFF